MTRPKNVGIKALQIYFPNECVEHSDLEAYDGVSTGKYTIGLGQTKMGFCSDREDIYSITLTTLSSLLRDYNIDPLSIGRLEVGTETLLDKSKSVKTVLMQLFEGNSNIEGVDTINACYGGTNALFNAVNWVESSAWDGRDAMVVAGDIAIYAQGAARPTGGAGCVAMLVGPDAPIVMEPGLRGSYMAHTYDFYKANLASEYALVDGHYSIQCYLAALDQCYKAYQERQKQIGEGRNPDVKGRDTTRRIDEKLNGYTHGSVNGHTNGHTNGYTNGHTNGCTNGHASDETNGGTNGNGRSDSPMDGHDAGVPLDQFDFMCFHSPTTKMVAKSYARLLYNDYLSNPEHEAFRDVPSELKDLSSAESLTSKVIEKTFSKLSAKRFAAQVQPSTLVGSNCGNIYTASVYGSLVSLLCNVDAQRLHGKRVGVFSFGSGLASTLFSLRIRGDVRPITDTINLHERLSKRMTVDPEAFAKACILREKAYSQKDFVPSGSIDSLNPGTYYLEGVDSMFRRSYKVR
ncbi:3-hydroxy-3-methylglutaryl coenzyme A synthase [Elasticomyces elasticus]|nr:3-hydroxy-3-methylglutaryl coenzyme A synthase [Elasticomyces elasticus]